MTTKLTSLFGRNVLELLAEQREEGKIVEYSKIEGDEFVKCPEDGFFLHAKNGNGLITDCRIYFESRDGYFEAAVNTRGEFGELNTVEQFENKFGPPTKEISAIQIPGAEPTLPGKIFNHGDKRLTVYSDNGIDVSYIHLKV